MRGTRAFVALASVAALAGCAAPATDAGVQVFGGRLASVAVNTHAATAHRQVARLALNRLVTGRAVAGRRVDVDQLVRATVCFHGACVHRRVRPDPVCDPSAGVCIGTALQAWRRHSLTVEVELA